MAMKCRTHRSCSFRVRKNRSMQPFPSGWRTKAAEDVRPKKEGDLGLEVPAEVDAAVVVAQRQARRAGWRERPEVVADPLAHGLQGFEAIACFAA